MFKRVIFLFVKNLSNCGIMIVCEKILSMFIIENVRLINIGCYVKVFIENWEKIVCNDLLGI